MSEHTPGPLDPPWVVMESDDAFEIHAAGGEGFIVAFVAKPGGPFDAEMPKAVKLIAAAPLLVEACKELLGRVESDCESDNFKTPEGDLGRAALSHLAGSDNG